MNPPELKKDFGKDLVFLGRGADAQAVLPGLSQRGRHKTRFDETSKP